MICSVLIRPAVSKSVLIPSPRIAFFQVRPPSFVAKIPPDVTFTCLVASVLSITVMPVLSIVADSFYAPYTKSLFSLKVLWIILDFIVPPVVIIFAALAYLPSLNSKFCTAAVIR